jgi:hypothetical protein
MGTVGDGPVPERLLREAFHASGERNFRLAKLFYSLLLGRGWSWAILGFAYMKCVDNVVDEDADVERARSYLAARRALMARAYGAESGEESSCLPDRFGFPLFLHDAARGERLRPLFDAMLDTMDFDLRRREALLTTEDLDDYLVKTGETSIRFLAHFVSPTLELRPRYLDRASRAYLYADSLIDLRYDLEHGIVNIPAEDVERLGMKLRADDPALREWVTGRAHVTEELFREALAETRRIDSWRMRALSRLYLWRKRRALRRFLAREGIEPRAA